jgi:uncharacterized protein GlcG (DUF336 family)
LSESRPQRRLRADAREIGSPSNIAVVDAGGNLIAHIRMDGAWIGSIDISINKAFTARMFDIPKTLPKKRGRAAHSTVFRCRTVGES